MTFKRTVSIGLRRLLLLSIGAIAAASVGPARAEEDKKLAAAEKVYNTYCFTCHGENLVSSGQTFDLRRLGPHDRARFDNAVLNGKGQMPPWKDVLSGNEVELLWYYIRVNANEK